MFSPTQRFSFEFLTNCKFLVQHKSQHDFLDFVRVVHAPKSILSELIVRETERKWHFTDGGNNFILFSSAFFAPFELQNSLKSKAKASRKSASKWVWKIRFRMNAKNKSVDALTRRKCAFRDRFGWNVSTWSKREHEFHSFRLFLLRYFQSGSLSMGKNVVS